MTEAAVVETPCGPFTVLARDSVVVASGWTAEPGDLVAVMPPSQRPASWTARPELGAITHAVHAYFAGQLDAIDAIAVRQRSGPFTEQVWQTLRALRPGAPVSYRELATLAGRPAAARAAGWACQANAVALFVPCHRARRGDGALAGFRWGLDIKRWLVEHEAEAGGASLRSGS